MARKRRPAPDAAGKNAERPSADFVRDAIIGGFDGLSERLPEWRVEPLAKQPRACTVFRAIGPGVPWPLAVKVYRPGADAAVVVRQAELLARCKERMVTPGLTVPTPYAMSAERRALAMEWVEAPSLRQCMARSGRNGAERANAFAVAGRWLREFHRQPEACLRPLAAARLERLATEPFGKRPGATKDVASRTFLRALDVLADCAAKLAEAPVPFVFCHGDFTPTNILHQQGRTVGIDLALCAYAPVTSDICRFLVRAETSKDFLTHRSTLAPVGVEGRDVAAFLRAYEDGAEPLRRDVFTVAFLAEALHRWASLFARPKAAYDLKRWAKHYRLRRMTMMASAAARQLC